jgi:hypothetical protein
MTLGEAIKQLIELGRFCEVSELVSVPSEAKDQAVIEILAIIKELEIPECLGGFYVNV